MEARYSVKVPQSTVPKGPFGDTLGTVNPGIKSNLNGKIPAKIVGKAHGELYLGQQDETQHVASYMAITFPFRVDNIGESKTDVPSSDRHFRKGQLLAAVASSKKPNEVTRRAKYRRFNRREDDYATPTESVLDRINGGSFDNFTSGMRITRLFPLDEHMYIPGGKTTATMTIATFDTAEVECYKVEEALDLVKKHPVMEQTLKKNKLYQTDRVEDGAMPTDVLWVVPILRWDGKNVLVNYIPVLNLTGEDISEIKAAMSTMDYSDLGPKAPIFSQLFHFVSRIGMVTHPALSNQTVWVVGIDSYVV
jgi:hypothetical protein